MAQWWVAVTLRKEKAGKAMAPRRGPPLSGLKKKPPRRDRIFDPRKKKTKRNTEALKAD